MPSSGDVVDLDLGEPAGHEAGFRHPAVVITAQRILDAGPAIVQARKAVRWRSFFCCYP